MKDSKINIIQRIQARRILDTAIGMGVIEPPKKCGVCGQTHGIIEYYPSDLRTIYVIKGRKPLCWTCHRMIVLRKEFRKATDEYFKDIVKFNFMPKPVYENDIKLLSKYGIGSIYCEKLGVDLL